MCNGVETTPQGVVCVRVAPDALMRQANKEYLNMFTVVDLNSGEELFSYESRTAALNMTNYLNRWAQDRRVGVNPPAHKDAYQQEAGNATSYV